MTKLGKGIKRDYRVECIDKNTFKATALLYYTDALHNTEYSFNEKETITINKEKVTKNLKQEKITTSVVGMILGLIILLFTYIVAGSINYYNNPVKACDNNNDVINDIKRGGN